MVPADGRTEVMSRSYRVHLGVAHSFVARVRARRHIRRPTSSAAMLPLDVIRTALAEIRANKLRSFFTLLGIIVSVAFLVAVVAVIQGMNAYVKENVANSLIG